MNDSSSRYDNEQFKVQQLYNLFNGNTEEEEGLETMPIVIMNSYGFDIQYTQGIDFETFQAVLQDLWTETFAEGKINKQNGEHQITDSLNCQFCKIAMFGFFCLALNKLLLKYSISSISQILAKLATTEGQTAWAGYLASFTATVGITDQILGTFQAYLLGGDGNNNITLKDIISSFLGFCCNKVSLCDSYSIYSGKFTFTNLLGTDITTGHCNFVSGDLNYKIRLDGLPKGGSTAPNDIQVYADKNQTWSLDVDTEQDKSKITYTGVIDAGKIPNSTFDETASLVASQRAVNREFYIDYGGLIVDGSLNVSSMPISGKDSSIQGRVLTPDGIGMGQLKVEVWDKDRLNKDDFLGFAITKADGCFSISIDEKDHKNWMFDWKPDVYFKIWKGTELIHSTEKNIIWNIKSPMNIDIKLPFFPS